MVGESDISILPQVGLHSTKVPNIVNLFNGVNILGQHLLKEMWHP